MNVTRSLNDEAAATDQPPKEYKCINCGGPTADWSKLVCDPCYEAVNADHAEPGI